MCCDERILNVKTFEENKIQISCEKYFLSTIDLMVI